MSLMYITWWKLGQWPAKFLGASGRTSHASGTSTRRIECATRSLEIRLKGRGCLRPLRSVLFLMWRNHICFTSRILPTSAWARTEDVLATRSVRDANPTRQLDLQLLAANNFEVSRPGPSQLPRLYIIGWLKDERPLSSFNSCLLRS